MNINLVKKKIKVVSVSILLFGIIFCGIKYQLGNFNLINSGSNNISLETIYPSNQPRPWTWNGDLQKLIEWNPAVDPDRDYNRGTVPLKEKFTNQDYWVNPNAKDSGKIAICSPWWQSQYVPAYVSSGSKNFRVQTYTWWQYNDVYMMFNNWHYLPSVEMIDAAHRNGVKVYSLIMNPSEQDITFLVQKIGNSYRGADKLIEICEYYGFDGWFFNFEAPGNKALAEAVRDFLIYFNKKGESKGIRIMWYDSMVENGNVSYQNELNSSNDWFFDYEGKPAAQEMFLNYWYSEQDLIDSRDLAKSVGRDHWDVYAGFETWQQYWNSGLDLGDRDVLYVPHLLSLALFQMNGLVDVAVGNTDLEWNDDYYSKAEAFYSGENHDPANTNTSKIWKGIAHYYPAKSVINEIPFVTNFTVGNGKLFAVDGKIKSSTDWNNRAIQDIQPSWRWLVESLGEKLIPKFEFTDAYYGGNCLKVSGNLVSDNLIKLYMTNLELSSNSKFEITYKLGEANISSNMKIALSFTESPDNWEYIEVGNSESADWNSKSLDISSYSGKTIGAIGVFFNGSANKPDYQMLLGQIGIVDGDKEIPVLTNSLTVENKVEDDADIASLRLKWNKPATDVRGYNVYRKNSDGTRTLVGATSTNYYFVPKIIREGKEVDCTIEVEAISKEFGISETILTIFNWTINSAPDQSSTPNPPNNFMYVKINPELSWAKTEGAISYNVNFGTTNPPPFVKNQTETNFLPSELELGKKYYWRIDVINNFGTTSGKVWSFNTNHLGAPKKDRTNETGNKFSALDQNLDAGETSDKAFDDDVETKWLDFNKSSWIQCQFEEGSQYTINEYSLTSANDAVERDPKDWVLKGSKDGVVWDTLDVQANQNFPERFYTKTYYLGNIEAYTYYRLEMNNNSGEIIQLAELHLYDYAGFETAPGKAVPIVAEDTTNIGLADILIWNSGENTGSHKVYLGTDSELDDDFYKEVYSNKFRPEALEQNTKYFWRVDEVNNIGVTKGDVWNFTTAKLENGWIKLTFDDFENGFGDFISGGEDCFLSSIPTYSHSGNNSITIQDNSELASSFANELGIDLDTPEYVQIKIDFWFFAKGINSGEDFFVQLFDGAEWHTIANYIIGDDFEINKFEHKIIHINEADYTFSHNMKIRFMADGSSDSDDYNIDDIAVYATKSTTVAVLNNQEQLPENYILKQNYPNPFNPSTTIEYSIPLYSASVKLTVYDVLGNEIKTLVNREQLAGVYKVEFDAVYLASGTYFYQLKSGDFSATKKLLLIK
ncbi:MAG: T9SS type A sorting domain-containing protein [Melioribacteraceae bacterium]|nr:T9SS type A sorting domain-containing protein [Melioribacteraceae bacterium]